MKNRLLYIVSTTIALLAFTVAFSGACQAEVKPMTFIATSSDTTPTTDTVFNYAFFPDLSVSEFKRDYGIAHPANERDLHMSVLNAMIDCNKELAGYRQNMTAHGHMALSEVPSPAYGEHKQTLLYYKQAVFYRARHFLTARLRSYDTTQSGHDRADELQANIENDLVLSRRAVADLTGEARVGVALL